MGMLACVVALLVYNASSHLIPTILGFFMGLLSLPALVSLGLCQAIEDRLELSKVVRRAFRNSEGKRRVIAFLCSERCMHLSLFLFFSLLMYCWFIFSMIQFHITKCFLSIFLSFILFLALIVGLVAKELSNEGK